MRGELTAASTSEQAGAGIHECTPGSSPVSPNSTTPTRRNSASPSSWRSGQQPAPDPRRVRGAHPQQPGTGIRPGTGEINKIALFACRPCSRKGTGNTALQAAGQNAPLHFKADRDEAYAVPFEKYVSTADARLGTRAIPSPTTGSPTSTGCSSPRRPYGRKGYSMTTASGWTAGSRAASASKATTMP